MSDSELSQMISELGAAISKATPEQETDVCWVLDKHKKFNKMRNVQVRGLLDEKKKLQDENKKLQDENKELESTIEKQQWTIYSQRDTIEVQQEKIEQLERPWWICWLCCCSGANAVRPVRS